jgi:ribonuclease Y
MEMELLGFNVIVVVLLSLTMGCVIGYFLRQNIAKKQEETAEAKVNKIFTEAKEKAAEILLSAKNKAVKTFDEIKQQEIERNRQLMEREKGISRREDDLKQRENKTEKERSVLQEKGKQVIKIKEEIDEIKKDQLVKLEKVAALSQEKAKKILLDKVEWDNQEEIVKKIKKLELDGKEEIDKKAQEIMTLAIQRYAGSQAAEITTSAVNIPDDEMKGRIIGREGRNIKALEQLTGVEVIVDDTPGIIVVSSFDPLRRQVAKLSLEKLISDGRIHPARIEETVENVKKELALKIKKIGETAVQDLGMTGLDPRLIQLFGRLRFRTSYGQNVLLPSLEVAYLSANIAAEIGADVAVAKKAGLLHDIGKAVDHEVEGTHVEIGMNLLKKFGISEVIIDAMKSHHEDYPFESTEAVIVYAADAISASRPGARKDTLDNYLKRLRELEDVANAFEGVGKSYAIQAGREIRIFVTPEEVDDLQAIKLSREIADKIEETLDYPGEIKVHVIRETRVVDYAR